VAASRQNPSQPQAPRKQTSGLRFECTQCGKCCMRRGKYAYVYLGDEEITRLAKTVGMTEAAFRRRYTIVDELGWTQIEFRDEYCPFLDRKSNGCTVYEARPVQCRTFPFWVDMVDERGWTAEAKTLCEGVGRGRVQPVRAVEAAMQEMLDAE
jgi:Fe-S-cluster containining protein